MMVRLIADAISAREKWMIYRAIRCRCLGRKELESLNGNGDSKTDYCVL